MDGLTRFRALPERTESPPEAISRPSISNPAGIPRRAPAVAARIEMAIACTTDGRRRKRLSGQSSEFVNLSSPTVNIPIFPAADPRTPAPFRGSPSPHEPRAAGWRRRRLGLTRSERTEERRRRAAASHLIAPDGRDAGRIRSDYPANPAPEPPRGVTLSRRPRGPREARTRAPSGAATRCKRTHRRGHPDHSPR
jgi:hypothetical protein